MENIIKLEKVEKNDAKDISELLNNVYYGELETVFKGKEEQLNIPGHGSADMQIYRTWDDKYYKIMYGNKMVGIVLVYTTGREHGRLDLLYILPEYQGKGIGLKVIQLVEEIFSEVKVWQTDTSIHSARNHRFYEKSGYIEDGEDEIDKYYSKIVGEVDSDREDYHIGLNYAKHNFRYSNYEESDWYDTNMCQSKFENMNFSSTVFANCTLRNSRFTNVNLDNLIIGDARMNDVVICNNNISNLYIHDNNLDDNKQSSFHIERCVMENSTIFDCDLKNLQINNCNLEGVVIDGISLEELMKCYKEKHI
jgi:GNAT superfamily N-acetyltransferase